MAELLECLICGYQTVRCGMTNHLKSKHPIHYDSWQSAFDRGTPEPLTKPVGQVKHWSKNRNQTPVSSVQLHQEEKKQ